MIVKSLDSIVSALTMHAEIMSLMPKKIVGVSLLMRDPYLFKITKKKRKSKYDCYKVVSMEKLCGVRKSATVPLKEAEATLKKKKNMNLMLFYQMIVDYILIIIKF